MVVPTSTFISQPDPEHPGWHTWQLDDPTRFNVAVMGRLIVRREGERGARLRMLDTRALHSNMHGNIHGGITLALADIGLFAIANTVQSDDLSGSVTLDLNCQFIGLGKVGAPIDCLGEVLKETGRLVFVRGTIEQAHGLVASFMGTLRKPSRPRDPR